jgi:hypothetical protein
MKLIIALIIVAFTSVSPVEAPRDFAEVVTPLVSPPGTSCVEQACSIRYRQMGDGTWEIGACFSSCGATCTLVDTSQYVSCAGCNNPCFASYQWETTAAPNCDDLNCGPCQVRLLEHTTWYVCTCP